MRALVRPAAGVLTLLATCTTSFADAGSDVAPRLSLAAQHATLGRVGSDGGAFGLLISGDSRGLANSLGWTKAMAKKKGPNGPSAQEMWPSDDEDDDWAWGGSKKEASSAPAVATAAAWGGDPHFVNSVPEGKLATPSHQAAPSAADEKLQSAAVAAAASATAASVAAPAPPAAPAAPTVSVATTAPAAQAVPAAAAAAKPSAADQKREAAAAEAAAKAAAPAEPAAQAVLAAAAAPSAAGISSGLKQRTSPADEKREAAAAESAAKAAAPAAQAESKPPTLAGSTAPVPIVAAAAGTAAVALPSAPDHRALTVPAAALPVSFKIGPAGFRPAAAASQPKAPTLMGATLANPTATLTNNLLPELNRAPVEVQPVAQRQVIGSAATGLPTTPPGKPQAAIAAAVDAAASHEVTEADAMKEAQREVDGIYGDATALKDDKSAAEERQAAIAQTEAAIAGLKKNVGEMESEKQQLMASLAKLVHSSSVGTGELEAAKGMSEAEQEQQVASLKKELDFRRAVNAQFQAGIERQSEFKARELEQQKELAEVQSQELTQEQARLDEMSQTNQLLLTHGLELSKKISSYEGSTKALRQRLEANFSNLEHSNDHDLDAMHAQVKEKEATLMRDLEDDRLRLQSELAQTSVELAKLHSDDVDLKREETALVASTSTMEAELDSLQTKPSLLKQTTVQSQQETRDLLKDSEHLRTVQEALEARGRALGTERAEKDGFVSAAAMHAAINSLKQDTSMFDSEQARNRALHQSVVEMQNERANLTTFKERVLTKLGDQSRSNEVRKRALRGAQDTREQLSVEKQAVTSDRVNFELDLKTQAPELASLRKTAKELDGLKTINAHMHQELESMGRFAVQSGRMHSEDVQGKSKDEGSSIFGLDLVPKSKEAPTETDALEKVQKASKKRKSHDLLDDDDDDDDDDDILPASHSHHGEVGRSLHDEVRQFNHQSDSEEDETDLDLAQVTPIVMAQVARK